MTVSEEREYLWFDSRWTRTDRKSRYEAAFWVFLIAYVSIWIGGIWMVAPGVTFTDPSPQVSSLAVFLWVSSMTVAIVSQIWYMICVPVYTRYSQKEGVLAKLVAYLSVSITIGLGLLIFAHNSVYPAIEISVLNTILNPVYAGVWIGGVIYLIFLRYQKSRSSSS